MCLWSTALVPLWQFPPRPARLPLCEGARPVIAIVIQSPGHQVTRSPEAISEAYEGDGIQVNSGQFDGLPNQQAKKRIAEWMEEKGIGKITTHWRLRDWLISRQR